MEKTTLGLIAALGAAAAAVTPASASAPANAADRILRPVSVAELLEPVADPVATLNALQAQQQLEPVEVAETFVVSHHHHHHHRRFIFMRHHHHHHHHHFYHHHHHHVF